MSGSTPGFSHTGRVAIVADTGAFITGAIRGIYWEMYTTPSVVAEVRDPDSRRILEELQASEKLHIVNPGQRALDEARKLASRGLSSTDLEVLALAVELRARGFKVYIVTDDYSLQASARRAGINIIPVRYRGVGRG